jgi:23S rRNA (uracil1939-C5)-methyltransferase
MMERVNGMHSRIGRPQYGGQFESDTGPALPFVLPGELVDEPGPEMNGLNVLEPSPQRIAPGCVHFGTCGGCHYQHAAYALQVQLKTEILSDLLQEAALGELPAIEVLASDPWGYRNRIRMRVRALPGEPVEFGYSMAGTNQFLPVSMCPIAAPLLWRAVETLQAMGTQGTRTRAWLEAAAEVELFSDAEQQRLQLRVLLQEASALVKEKDSFNIFCEALHEQLPELHGAGALLAPELSRRVRLSWNPVRWGAEGLNYEAAGRSYWVSQGAFFQVNRFLLEGLVSQVTELAGTGDGVAWDLFAGVGLFTRALAERFGRVIAVEGAETAAADLLAGARGVRGTPAYVGVEMTVADFLRAQQTQRERPEVVVLDPPRAGLGEENAELLAKLLPRRIVYVSCDPVTLVRDLRVFARKGYQLRTVHLVDLFPQTFHLESVVMLER